MPSLRERQQAFCDALFADSAAAHFDLADSASGSVRLTIYRRNVFANYRNALAATYSVIRELVGADAFAAAVDDFVRAHPSHSGDLNVYGDTFADFLATLPSQRALPYVPDIAQLEWAIDESNRAKDSARTPEAVLANLASIPGEELPNLRLRLAPSCRLLASEFPIFDVWQDKERGRQGAARGTVEANPDRLLVRRDSRGVLVERIEPGEFEWLEALSNHEQLGEAIEKAQAADPAFDLATVLHRNIANGTVVGRDDD